MARRTIDEERAWRQAYNQRPEVRARRKAYDNKPEVKAKRATLQRAWKQRPEVKAKLAKKAKAYYHSHQPERSAYSKKYLARPDVRDAKRAYQLRWNYGLTPDEFASLLATQGGVCAVCELSDWGKRGPVVDHDHATGRVRGILCIKCNAAAGMLCDDFQRAEKLSAYLRKFLK